MAVYIQHEDALQKLIAVEGSQWGALQEAKPESGYGFYAWREAFHRKFEEEGATSDSRIADYMMVSNDGAIYGEGGVSRYRVLSNGEIILITSSATTGCKARAKEQGITLR